MVDEFSDSEVYKIERLCERLIDVYDKEDANITMAALATCFGDLVNKCTNDPVKIKAIYGTMAEAAIALGRMEYEFTGNAELQTEKNSTQEKAAEKKRQKAGNVSGSSSVN